MAKRLSLVSDAMARMEVLRNIEFPSADVVHDRSEQKPAEDLDLQTERLAAIGQMMTALTHESRNLLQLCQALLETLEMEIADRPRALACASRIQQTQDKLARLFEDMRQFAAPLHLEREPFHLGYLAGHVLNDLSSVHRGRQIRLREVSNSVDLRCAVDPFRLHQVFRNIMDNSVAACRDPVRLCVIWSETELDGEPALEVTLRDNGPGLSAEQKRRMFEPFFTTKKSGTGLGLAISRSIVEAHGGRIVVGNNGHKGAEFVITLPRHATPPHS